MHPGLKRRDVLRAAALATAPGVGTLAQAAAAPIQTGVWSHAISAFGPPKYGPDFKHFDYVDPAAPKGGTMRLSNSDRRSSFDKFNPFTIKGVAQASFLMLTFERLCEFSMDEPKSMYGLLAEAIYVEPDLSAVSFRLRSTVRFSPLTSTSVYAAMRNANAVRVAPAAGSMTWGR